MNKQEDLTGTLQGLPTLALLPARQFTFSVSEDTFMFKMPNKGKFSEVDTEFFAEDPGEFEIFSEGNVNISILTKVLFATRQYPDMADNQLFCPINFKLDGEEVVIYGQLVTLKDTSNE